MSLQRRITTTNDNGRWQRFKLWLAMLLLRKLGFWLQVEARYGAHRTRHRTRWKGELVFVDIPLQHNSKKAGTSTPFGFVPGGQEQAIIDQVTALEGTEPFPDFHNADTIKVCPFCGNERKDVL